MIPSRLCCKIQICREATPSGSTTRNLIWARDKLRACMTYKIRRRFDWSTTFHFCSEVVWWPVGAIQLRTVILCVIGMSKSWAHAFKMSFLKDIAYLSHCFRLLAIIIILYSWLLYFLKISAVQILRRGHVGTFLEGRTKIKILFTVALLQEAKVAFLV